MVAISRILRRSQRSEKWPSGYWISAPPMIPTDDEGHNVRHRHADLFGIDRAQRSERTVRHAHRDRPMQPSGEMRKTRIRSSFTSSGAFGIGAVAERDRHQRQRDHHRHDGEDGKAARAEYRNEELRAGDRADVDDAVERKHARPVVVGDARIQPALHDGEEAGKAEAADEAHRRPHVGVDHQHQQQRAGRGRGGERSEGADMPDRLHDADDGQAPEQEAAEIGGAHEADDGWRKTLLRAAQRDQRTLQPVAAEQDACGDQQRDQGAERGQVGSQRRESASLV